jgi:hypothetical protein
MGYFSFAVLFAGLIDLRLGIIRGRSFVLLIGIGESLFSRIRRIVKTVTCDGIDNIPWELPSLSCEQGFQPH